MQNPAPNPRVLATVSLLGLLAASAWGQSEQFREREILDPSTDQWSPQTQPASAPSSQPAGGAEEVDIARGELARGEYRPALARLKAWANENPDHDRYYEAVFLWGEALFQKPDYWAALEKFEEVAENASGDLFDKANRRAMDVGRAFLAGRPRILWKIFRLPAYDDGVETLDRVYERLPGTRLGESVLKLKADYYFANGDVQLAQDEYAFLATEYPNGRFSALAMVRSAESAQAAFQGTRFDDRPLVEADERYRQAQKAFPDYAEREHVPQRLEGIRAARAEKDLDVARWYEKTRQGGAAEFYYRQILKDWPGTLAAVEARRRLRAMGVEAPAAAPPRGPDAAPAEGVRE